MNYILSPDHFYNCPLCGMDCRVEDSPRDFNLLLNKNCAIQQFFCLNPLAKDPLHYYSHIVDKSEPNRIAAHEIRIDLGNRYVVLVNNYQIQRTYLRTASNKRPLEVPVLLVPDFPHLDSLRKKIRTALTFT
jgi:transcription elongation factor Elf1